MGIVLTVILTHLKGFAVLDVDKEAYLKTVYYDPAHPASYSGLNKLYRALKRDGRFDFKIRELKEWLRTQETYGVHRQRRRNFSRPMVVVSGIGRQADADLMDMTQLAEYNDGVKYVLLHIDDFSKYVRTVPLHSKTGKEVAEAFKSIFRDGGKTDKLRTDRGTEFTNKIVQKLFRDEGVHHFLTSTEKKASIAERAIKTLKSKYFRHMTEKQTFRYTDILDEVTFAYNHRFHRSIGMRPVDVTEENEGPVWHNIYGKMIERNRQEGRQKFRFQVGDWVRISFLTRPFEREYEEKWTYEFFKITSRDYVQNTPVYTLEDFAGDEVKGRFYQEELQPVTVLDNAVYKIEKVIKTRKRRNHPKEYLVRYVGWPPKFDSWITEDALQDIRSGAT